MLTSLMFYFEHFVAKYGEKTFPFTLSFCFAASRDARTNTHDYVA